MSRRRYKCSDCRDFDLCESCYKKRDWLHPGHSFKIVPGHVLPFPLELSVCCDGCGKKQVQPQDRFKCLECPDYDLCTSCFEQRSLIHPEHSTWQHLGQRLCCGSAPPAEPEPESGHEDGDVMRCHRMSTIKLYQIKLSVYRSLVLGAE